MKVYVKAEQDWMYRAEVAKSDRLRINTINALAKDKSAKVRAALAGNPVVPAEVLAKLAKDTNDEVRRQVAHNKSTDPEVLTALSKDSSSYVRQGVASNRSTPPDVLVALAGKDSWVGGTAIDNPNFPVEALVDLAKKSRYGYNDTLRFIAHNPKTPSDTLDSLIDQDMWVLEGVSRNKNTTADTLVKISKQGYFDRWDSVRQNVARHPNTPDDLLAKLASDPATYVRLAVYDNPNTPDYIIDQLVDDPEIVKILEHRKEHSIK